MAATAAVRNLAEAVLNVGPRLNVPGTIGRVGRKESPVEFAPSSDELSAVVRVPTELLKSSDVSSWNEWRSDARDAAPDEAKRDVDRLDLRRLALSSTALAGVDLRFANMSNASLVDADLRGADLHKANLAGADLSGALLDGARLTGANLSGAVLNKARLREVDATDANFSWSQMRESNLTRADLTRADLSRADLFGARLTSARLIEARLIRSRVAGARFGGAEVFGLSVWGLEGSPADQRDLVVTPIGDQVITIDNLKVAQLIYLLIDNTEIRGVVDALTARAVLILGRFTPSRKSVLDALKGALRTHGLLPILFDFEKPSSRDVTETVTLLARMSRFVVVDLSEPASVPHELYAIAPHVAVPIVPLISVGSPYSMFDDLRRKYRWVLQPVQYNSADALVTNLQEMVIEPAEAAMRDLGLL